MDFELVIHALEELEALATVYGKRAIADEFRPVAASFLTAEASPFMREPELLKFTRHRLLHAIADACHARTYASDVSRLREFFDFLDSAFSLSVFTLNYDDLIDRAVSLSDGFTRRHLPSGKIPFGREVWCFDAADFQARRISNEGFLAHLHGSVRFGYEIECAPSIVKWDTAIDALASVFQSETPSHTDHGHSLGIGPIISGYNKGGKLAGNPEPYAYYYSAFTDALLSSPRLLVVGYGAMDLHVNTWIEEFGRTHGPNRRLAWITHIPGSDVGGGLNSTRRRDDIALLKALARSDGFRDGNAFAEGIPFDIQGTIALACAGFPAELPVLREIVGHLRNV